MRTSSIQKCGYISLILKRKARLGRNFLPTPPIYVAIIDDLSQIFPRFLEFASRTPRPVWCDNFVLGGLERSLFSVTAPSLLAATISLIQVNPMRLHADRV